MWSFFMFANIVPMWHHNVNSGGSRISGRGASTPEAATFWKICMSKTKESGPWGGVPAAPPGAANGYNVTSTLIAIHCNSLCKLSISENRPCRSHRCPTDINHKICFFQKPWCDQCAGALLQCGGVCHLWSADWKRTRSPRLPMSPV